jgi:hypothetical protein
MPPGLAAGITKKNQDEVSVPLTGLGVCDLRESMGVGVGRKKRVPSARTLIRER